MLTQKDSPHEPLMALNDMCLWPTALLQRHTCLFVKAITGHDARQETVLEKLGVTVKC